MSQPVVEMRGVFFSYNGCEVLQDVNFDVHQGDFIAVIGPNGGGKTTLLRLMLGLIKPDRGSVRVLGMPAQKASHRIGYVPQEVQSNRSFPITSLDVVLMGKLEPGRRFSRRSGRDREEAMEALERMDMAAFAGRRIDELSGGQRQRVYIARAMVTKPALLLLDEPTSSIDTRGQADFFRFLKNINNQVTILLVSHDLLVISTHVKSVACVNRRLHHHGEAEITGDMVEMMYPCTAEEVCPVELLAHGLPHRVLKDHRR
ncbi:MAG: metal ABC transporter ATP-binding protein [Deltaproteobacteria bacterium]|nr:metal ABC transporter ATP-binding protein [Deltaproteobacteria bacterium]